MYSFHGKDIVLGITGGIAAYKAAEIVRQAVKLDAAVHVVMTESACEFITPLTLQTLSGNPVVTDMFSLAGEREIGHICLAERADLLAVAPATANCLGKVAAGIADDMLTTVITATRAPILFAPAMNVNMWHDPIVQRNVQVLRDAGYHCIEPAAGDLACGTSGQGRLPEPDAVIDAMLAVLSPKDFAGRGVLVTAGPTRESLDPVRYLTNPSSGKMGYAVARALQHRGADVTLVSGPTDIPVPAGVRCIHIKSAADMARAVETNCGSADVIIKTAAVADYKPLSVSGSKIKKSDSIVRLELERTEDILAGLGRQKGGRLLIGFAAETDDLLENARKKLQCKNCDMIVANDVGNRHTGFASDRNKVTFMYADGSTEDIPEMGKGAVAEALIDRIAKMMNKKGCERTSASREEERGTRAR